MTTDQDKCGPTQTPDDIDIDALREATPPHSRAPRLSHDGSLDHLVGGSEKRFGDGEAERLGGLEVDG